jgi:hypothetical protein
MPRKRLEVIGAEKASEIMADAIDDLQDILAWSDNEYEIASRTFNKPIQGRLAKLNSAVANLSMNVARLNMLIESIRRGESGE